MFYALLKTLHLLAIIVWVGGMVFAHFYLRPALTGFEPPVRLALMCHVLRRFFRHVLWASLIALVTGLWMVGRTARTVAETGGQFSMPLSWTIMATLGIVMVLVFLWIRFRLYVPMEKAVSTADWPEAGQALAQIRKWVTVNMVLGLLIVVVTLMT